MNSIGELCICILSVHLSVCHVRKNCIGSNKEYLEMQITIQDTVSLILAYFYRMNVRMCVYVCMYVYIYMCVCISTYMYVCMYVVRICMHVVYIYICTNVCM